MRPMNKTMIERVLVTLADGAAESLYLVVAIHEAGYGASRKQIERKQGEIRNRKFTRQKEEEFIQKRRNLYSLLSHLKQDGLIEKENAFWGITPLGKAKLQGMKAKPKKGVYKREIDNTLKIVIFDIPEKERWKRAWLRDALQNLGFKIIQKSVWAGKVKLPQGFLEDLEKYNLLNYVEIFSVTKSGTLRSLKDS